MAKSGKRGGDNLTGGFQNPLTETRQKRDNKREEWAIAIAKNSAAYRWSPDKVEIEVRKAAESALLAGNIRTRKSFENLVSEGKLACNVDVREHVPRLVLLRDKVWELDPELLRDTLHGPWQTLTNLMQRQRKAVDRRHVVDEVSYFAYLRKKI